MKTQRGKRKLCYAGYYYTVEKDVGEPPNNKITWKCERTGNKTTVKCSGRAYSINHYEPVLETVNHNHEPEPEKTKCYQIVDLIKDHAASTNDNPRSIIKKNEIELDDESAAKMVRHHNLRQIINRTRSKRADYGPNATSIEEIECPDALKVTYKGDKFYFGSLGSKDRRVFIFTTECNFKLMNEYCDWYCDGTFDVAPKLFRQLYTVNIIVKNKNLPMVYALIPDKSQVSYVLFFKFLSGYIRIPPRSIMTDFEKAALNAIRKNFQETSLQGCYFHLASNLWKHVVNEGLKVFYCENKEFRMNFKYVKALAFIPVKDVPFAFTKIKEIATEAFFPILNYFEGTYIGQPVKGKHNLRKAPLFDIDLWNINIRVMQDLPRANNSIESWHKQFEIDCKKHPSFNKIVEQFRLEQNNTEVLYLQIQAGDNAVRNKIEVKRDEAIKQILLNYKKKEMMEAIAQLVLII